MYRTSEYTNIPSILRRVNEYRDK